jgi:CRISPR-associated endonuclease/helicase Cas3
MDSINQAAGRCNRNGVKDKGLVKIFKRKHISRIYDDVLLGITREVLSSFQSVITEPEIYEINKAYFHRVKERIQNDSNASINLLNAIYGLQFEEIEKEFKLIPNKNYEEYNVFIPLNAEAEVLWEKYLEKLETANPYERKAAVKKIKPAILKYVVAVPDYCWQPNETQNEKSLIKLDDWETIYDVLKGVIVQKKTSPDPIVKSF